jgi:hypothetical protein
MDFQDAETWRPSAEAATEAAPFDGVPRTVGSSRNLPIRGVSDSVMQRAQAPGQAETSATTPRNLPIREVSDSATQRDQDQDVRYQQAIEMSEEVTRCRIPAEQDLAYHRMIGFIYHPTPLQAETSRILHQDHATPSDHAAVVRMSRTSSFRGTSIRELELLRVAQVQRRSELITRKADLEFEIYSLEAELDSNPVKAPVQTSPTDESTEWNGLPVPVYSFDFPVPDVNAMEDHALKIAHLSEQLSSTLRIMTGFTTGPSVSSGAAESTTAS